MAAGGCGTVRVKLFNLLLAELGPLVLARGLILERDELDGLAQSIPDLTKTELKGAERILLSVTFSK